MKKVELSVDLLDKIVKLDSTTKSNVLDNIHRYLNGQNIAIRGHQSVSIMNEVINDLQRQKKLYEGKLERINKVNKKKMKSTPTKKTEVKQELNNELAWENEVEGLDDVLNKLGI